MIQKLVVFQIRQNEKQSISEEIQNKHYHFREEHNYVLWENINPGNTFVF